MADIGSYVARIISAPRTLNRHVFAYTEVLSMNEIWDTMARVSGETTLRNYVSQSLSFLCSQHSQLLINTELSR